MDRAMVMQAWKKLARKWHPDKIKASGLDEAAATEKMQTINGAKVAAIDILQGENPGPKWEWSGTATPRKHYDGADRDEDDYGSSDDEDPAYVPCQARTRSAVLWRWCQVVVVVCTCVCVCVCVCGTALSACRFGRALDPRAP